MHHHYKDIRDRIAEEPKWFDEHAVPRYAEFAPDETANIYADRALLLLIECQACGTEFKVAMTQTAYDRHGEYPQLSFEALTQTGRLHYGDPPNTGCCPAGATMNSVPMRVLEFWARERDERGVPTWVRKPELEIEVTPDWAHDEDDEVLLPRRPQD